MKCHLILICELLVGSNSLQEFKRNLKKTNGGEDFEEEMLEEIYTAIRYKLQTEILT